MMFKFKSVRHLKAQIIISVCVWNHRELLFFLQSSAIIRHLPFLGDWWFWDVLGWWSTIHIPYTVPGPPSTVTIGSIA